MTEEELQQALKGTQDELDEAKRECARWKREAADLSNTLSSNRSSNRRADALRRIMFETGCTGLAFVGRNPEDPEAPILPVIVPISAFREEDDPRRWPEVVKELCALAVQVQANPVEFEPLTEAERYRYDELVDLEARLRDGFKVGDADIVEHFEKAQAKAAEHLDNKKKLLNSARKENKRLNDTIAGLAKRSEEVRAAEESMAEATADRLGAKKT